MQISRMPIPADDCSNNEMSMDANPSDTNSDLENKTKVNGDSHKKLNGNALDDSKENEDTSVLNIVVKEELISPNENLPENTDELVENGILKEDKSEEKIEESNNDEISTDTPKIEDKKDKDEEAKSMEVDQTKDQPVEDVIVKKELAEVEPEVTEDMETQEEQNLNNGDTNHSEEVVKDVEGEANQVIGEVRHSDEEKSIKSEEVKVPEEEDMSSEISTDTPSPKQV